MPFRVCLKLIEVAIDCQVPHSSGEGRVRIRDWFQGMSSLRRLHTGGKDPNTQWVHGEHIVSIGNK
jgi:hypothetical protein